MSAPGLSLKLRRSAGVLHEEGMGQRQDSSEDDDLSACLLENG
jgi:hypothetical protein